MTSISPAAVLRRFPMFSGLNDEERHEIFRICRPFSLQAGEVLFKEHSRSNGVFLVEQGAVEISTVLLDPARKVVVRTLTDGAIIGDVALIDEGKRSATATALSETRGFRIDGRSFRRLRRAHHPAATKVLRQIAETLSQRLRQLTERLTRQPARTKAPASPALRQRADLNPEQRRYVRHFPFFKDFDDRTFDTLLSVLTVCGVKTDQVLFREGSRGTTCYFLVKGSIDVHVERRGRARKLTTLKPGTLFGQLALIDSHPRSATCQAAEGSIVLQMDRSAFTGLFAHDSPLASQFIYALDVVLASMLRRATLQMRQLEAQLEKKRLTVASQPYAELQEMARKNRTLGQIMNHLELACQDIDLEAVQIQTPGLY